MAGETSRTTRIVRQVTGGLLLVLLIAGGYLLYHFHLVGMLRHYLEGYVPPSVFIVLMAILPVAGVPISLFLVLVGMKFGIAGGILLTAALMSFHMATTYYLVHTLLRDRIARLLRRFRVSTPTLLKNYTTWQVVIFMLVPGLPYVVKNNLLALAGLRFLRYMTINLSTQYLHSIPLIVLGGAAIQRNVAILAVALLLLMLGFLVQQYFKRRSLARSRKSGDD
jgi:uncharacterized membrane protein YdjX (TVP38/TMEM64 family)